MTSADGIAATDLLGPESSNSLSRNYCDFPFSSMYVATDGSVAPCCEYAGSAGNVRQETLLSIWNGEKMTALRREFEGPNLPGGCRKCIDREKSEGGSLRVYRLKDVAQRIKPFQVPPTPRTIDFRLSNLCNLRCRTCSPSASSKWYSDAIAIGHQVSHKSEIRSFRSTDDLFLQFSEILGGLESITFAGGEPFLSEEHYKILEILIANQKTDVDISYVTNLTVLGLKDWKILDLWASFSSILVEASVDGIGERGKIIRKDFDWEVFCRNVADVRKHLPNITLSFGITISIFNILTVVQLLEALQKECGATPDAFWTHSLQWPTFYRTQVLPKALKIEASRRIDRYIRANGQRIDSAWLDFVLRLQGLKDYMNAEDLSSELPVFRDVTARLDAVRNESLQSVLPELAMIWTSVEDRPARGLSKLRSMLSNIGARLKV